MANAGCINAYDCNGCLIQTLQNLDSACIGVGVQYTAPNPLDDKRLDYIKYTDKCGCVQCLSGENEILIYATNGVIKNLTLTNDDVNEAIKIQWNDIFGSNRAKTIVRYKTGSYPVSITDGTLAVEETTKNQYSSTPFSLSGVLDETTYYISAFAVDSNGTIIDVQSNSITTDFTIVQEFDFSTSDHGFTRAGSNYSDGVSHGRDSNGLYIVGQYSQNNAGYFNIPSSAIQGTLMKIEFELYSNYTKNGGGFVSNAVSSQSGYSWKDYPGDYVRAWRSAVEAGYGSNTGSKNIEIGDLPSGGYKLTFDLVNGYAFISTKPNDKLLLDNNYVSMARTRFTNGQMKLCIMKGLNSYGNSYMKKVIFYSK